MPCAPQQRFGGVRQDDYKPEAGEVMSGVLEVIRPYPPQRGDNSQRVFVRVYRTSSEHFAVLYPIRAIVAPCRAIASVNLRSCSVKPLPGSGREFRVTPRACEGVSLAFRALAGSSESHVSAWLDAFSNTVDMTVEARSKVSRPLLTLPVLVESEEEEEEECA